MHFRRGAALALLVAGAIGVLASGRAMADEPLFGYVYTTDLLPKGKTEVEQWITDRHGQSHGSFNDVQMRSEFEKGLRDDLQGALYLNYSHISANGNDMNGKTTGLDIPTSHDPNKPYNAFRLDGVSLELIKRFKRPYKDGYGLAFYVEPELGLRERGVEFRGIFQKNWLDDQLVFAANVWVEPEWEKSGAGTMDMGANNMDMAASGSGWEKATMLEADLGLSYRFAPGWSAGLEFRNHNEYSGHTLSHSHQDHTAFFLGPNIHYASKKWFATLSWLKQVHAVAYSPDQQAVMSGGKIYGDEHTRDDGIRLKVGYLFD